MFWVKDHWKTYTSTQKLANTQHSIEVFDLKVMPLAGLKPWISQVPGADGTKCTMALPLKKKLPMILAVLGFINLSKGKSTLNTYVKAQSKKTSYKKEVFFYQ